MVRGAVTSPSTVVLEQGMSVRGLTPLSQLYCVRGCERHWEYQSHRLTWYWEDGAIFIAALAGFLCIGMAGVFKAV